MASQNRDLRTYPLDRTTERMEITLRKNNTDYTITAKEYPSNKTFGSTQVSQNDLIIGIIQKLAENRKHVPLDITIENEARQSLGNKFCDLLEEIVYQHE
ncbi:hypothetical protein CMI45_02545 [Candidatus Pacearchaeota archaeon]|nr:hypothetical protein [Candidatus Pacearchaeota archaeon]|tara:strand:- start:485 stop:784 length:300 start_codon:yes stop_codon:yes gene_type:complete